MFDLKSWLTGFALGLAGKPLPLVAGKPPIAYLYNGVQLPALPKWDRETYPYAIIARIGIISSEYVYTLRLFRSAYTTSGTNVLYSFYNMTADIGKTWLGCSCPYTDLGDGTFMWSGIREIQIVENDSAETTTILVGTPIWSNFDLTTNGGTVWLAASEPTPIYE